MIPKIKEPDIYHTLVLSTAHIKYSDSLILEEYCNSYKSSISVYNYEYGWSIFVPEDPGLLSKECMIDEGFSEELYNLLVETRNQKCKFLCLDQDGLIYSEFPEFEW